MTRAILIRKSTGDILKRGEYPVADMSAVPGLDPDLEWLIQTEPYGAPEYDSRIFQLVKNENITTKPHPVYTHLNQFQITYETDKRSDEEIIAAIENAERLQNDQIFDNTEQIRDLTLVVSALVRSIKKLKLEPEEKELITKLTGIGVKFRKNEENRKRKKKQIEDGEEPDIDSDWEGRDVPIIDIDI